LGCDDFPQVLLDGLNVRAAPRNSTTEPDRMATADGYSTATGEGDSNIDSDMNKGSHTVTSSRGDADDTLYDRVVHYTLLGSEDAVELVLKVVEKPHDIWPTLKESNYFNLHGGKNN
jgi:hypothetical protein